MVQTYLKQIYSPSGDSRVLVTDNGTEFKNSLSQEVCNALSLTQHYITAYLPSSNLVEQHHSSMKKCISKFCQKDTSCRDEIVPYTSLEQKLFQHTLEGESTMFKMFAWDTIVLGMETMLKVKHRYLGDKNTFNDLKALHNFQVEVAMWLYVSNTLKGR